MIIRKQKEISYCVEMTAEQATNLHLLLETGKGGHVNELAIQEKGKSIADLVHDTITDLREALENR